MTATTGAQEGSVALVTGGSDGIGKAVAARLLREGGSVVICGRDRDRLESAVASIEPDGSDRLLGVPADCRSVDDIRTLYETAVAAYGPVSTLINNVGTSKRGAFLDLTDEEWVDDFELKVFSAVRLSRMVAGALVEQGLPGRIVNILSIGGKHPGAGSAPTTVSRAAGLALTKVLSKELAPHGILVNAVCIGMVESGQHDRRWRETGGERAEFYQGIAESRGIPVGRVGKPEEVAGLVNLLVSKEGSYITGTAVNVDGGTSSAL